MCYSVNCETQNEFCNISNVRRAQQAAPGPADSVWVRTERLYCGFILTFRDVTPWNDN